MNSINQVFRIKKKIFFITSPEKSEYAIENIYKPSRKNRFTDMINTVLKNFGLQRIFNRFWYIESSFYVRENNALQKRKGVEHMQSIL